MTNSLQITNHLTQAASAEALRLYVGPRKQYSYEAIGIAIDVDERTVEGWVLGRSTPNLCNWLNLARVIGGDFINQYIRLIGFDGAEPMEDRDVTDAEMNAEAAELVAAFSKALRDLRVDHQEKPLVIKIARKAHTMLTDWLNAQDRHAHSLRKVKR